MPLYEYRCQRCDDVFEVIQRFSDEPLTVHEKCGGPVERLLSAPALQFKGTGWYVTDYAKSGSNGSSKEARSDKKSDAKPSESKTSESKSSESKTESPKPAASSSSSDK